MYVDEIVRTLGEGTFAKVVQVRDTRSNGAQLALKVKKRKAHPREIDVFDRLKERDPDGRHRHLVIQARRSIIHQLGRISASSN